MMSSVWTLRLNRRRALSIDSPSCSRISANQYHHPTQPKMAMGKSIMGRSRGAPSEPVFRLPEQRGVPSEFVLGLLGQTGPGRAPAVCGSGPSPYLRGDRMKVANRGLMWHGIFLFLLGLFTGFAELRFANPRMGLAAHLEGVMNGTFLLALGAAWNEVRLKPGVKTIAYWTALYGAYANWLVTTLAAVFGTAALSPITAA